jgi:hypothetical protein
MSKKGKGKRPAASTKGNTKKKPRDNVVGGSKFLAPQRNNGVAKLQLKNYMYDPVIPELDVACHRELNTMGVARPLQALRQEEQSSLPLRSARLL